MESQPIRPLVGTPCSHCGNGAAGRLVWIDNLVIGHARYRRLLAA
jgi:hypothetical protein